MTARDLVLYYVKLLGPTHSGAIAQKLGLSIKHVSSCLYDLRQDGKIHRVRHTIPARSADGRGRPLNVYEVER